MEAAEAESFALAPAGLRPRTPPLAAGACVEEKVAAAAEAASSWVAAAGGVRPGVGACPVGARGATEAVRSRR